MKNLVMPYLKNANGSILIFVIWALIFLTVLAVQIGMRVRARVGLLARIERKSQLHHIAGAGIKLARAALRNDQRRNKGLYTAYSKYYLSNNSELFENKSLGQGFFSVTYPYYDGSSLTPQMRFGLVDEESKLNINYCPKEILLLLIRQVAVPDEDEALVLTEALIDWREFGESQITGFYSDDFYANLEDPYEPKNNVFELPEELLLLRGMTPSIYDILRPFITMYGDGKVNINTVSKEILVSLGLQPATADKILRVRRGYDEIEGTVDDYVFNRAYDVSSDIKNFIELEQHEANAIDRLNFDGVIKTASSYYTIRSRARIASGYNHTIECVLNLDQNRYEYWREK
ncbi:MAG: general secretion pathway protein GspK [Candidatus Omnitrophica bacterium]|nr:general secretion pathway protein GspK [Candidatus Omnitrophota bacterium]